MLLPLTVCLRWKLYLAAGFLAGAITSLAAFATRNFTTVLALILICSPVAGLSG